MCCRVENLREHALAHLGLLPADRRSRLVEQARPHSYLSLASSSFWDCCVGGADIPSGWVKLPSTWPPRMSTTDLPLPPQPEEEEEEVGRKPEEQEQQLGEQLGEQQGEQQREARRPQQDGSSSVVHVGIAWAC